MTQLPDALWLNVSPALKKIDYPLLKQLSRHCSIARWEYCQNPDEPISLETALVLLQDYLKHRSSPVHLLGHGTGGLLGLLYARSYPERVGSLTLLSVGVYPAVDWQAHYYAALERLACSRAALLSQMVYTLFGQQSRGTSRELVQVLEQDLKSSLSPHTLYQRASWFPGGVSVPLMVCGSQDDWVIDPNLLQGWQTWLKAGDRLWECPQGRYFFHYFHPQRVSEQILDFWASQSVNQLAQVSREPVQISA